MMNFKIKTKLRIKIASLLIILFSSSVVADVTLPRLISDGAILQRDSANLIWGWADNGEQVSVKLDGKLVGTNTTQNKQWFIKLPAHAVGGPHKIEITGHNAVTVNDVYFGDVWLASGQSNMELPIRRVKVRYPQEAAQANYPQIRQFLVPKSYDFEGPRDDVSGGQWVSVNTKTIDNFSAVGYFFAKHLHQKYQVPIGIINSSYGGSPAEGWMSEQALAQYPYFLEKIKKYREPGYLKQVMASDKKRNDAWYKKLNTQDLGLQQGGLSWFDNQYDYSNWQTVTMPSSLKAAGIEFGSGTIWLKKEFHLSAADIQSSALLNLGRIVDADTVYVNGTQVGSTTYEYPPRRYAVEQNILKTGINTITVRLTVNADNGAFVTDKPYFIELGEQRIKLDGQWQYKIGVQLPKLVGPSFSQYIQPLGFYNAMLAPVLKTRLKGAIWYQGESNGGRPDEYMTLFPAMIRDWRKQFQQGDFPFIYVQLANFMEEKAQPEESSWAGTREAQRLALSEPNTAMAVAIDVGEWNDIHPLNKKAVGDRLALAARKLAYGDNLVVYAGPQIKSMQVIENKAVLSFELLGSTLAVRGANSHERQVQGFAIAGKDGKFVWAKAKIVGDKIHVYSDQVLAPVTVRYAWANNPAQANLMNVQGLPASPFQIDK